MWFLSTPYPTITTPYPTITTPYPTWMPPQFNVKSSLSLAAPT